MKKHTKNEALTLALALLDRARRYLSHPDVQAVTAGMALPGSTVVNAIDAFLSETKTE